MLEGEHRLSLALSGYAIWEQPLAVSAGDALTLDVLMHPDRYDVIVDTLGVSTFGTAKARLTVAGRYICPLLTLPLLIAAAGMPCSRRKAVVRCRAGCRA